MQFGYGLNYLIDIENAVIVDVEATPARTYDEVVATKLMINRIDERMGLKPKRLVADTAYGTAKFLSWLIGTRFTPHIRDRPGLLLVHCGQGDLFAERNSRSSYTVERGHS